MGLKKHPFRTRGTLSRSSLGGETRAWNNHRLNYACVRNALKSPSLYPLLPRLLLACIRPLRTRTVNTRFRTRNIWNNISGHNIAVTREGRDRGVTISPIPQVIPVLGLGYRKNLYTANVSPSPVADLRHADRWALVILGLITRFHTLFRYLSIPRLGGGELKYVHFVYIRDKIHDERR